MSLGMKENSDVNQEKQVGFWKRIGETKRTACNTHYLRVSRSKAAGVVVDLLKDEAPVHEGETSLRTKQPTTVST